MGIFNTVLCFLLLKVRDLIFVERVILCYKKLTSLLNVLFFLTEKWTHELYCDSLLWRSAHLIVNVLLAVP